MKLNFNGFRINTVHAFNILIDAIKENEAIDEEGDYSIKVEMIADEIEHLRNHIVTLICLEGEDFKALDMEVKSLIED